MPSATSRLDVVPQGFEHLTNGLRRMGDFSLLVDRPAPVGGGRGRPSAADPRITADLIDYDVRGGGLARSRCSADSGPRVASRQCVRVATVGG